MFRILSAVAVAAGAVVMSAPASAQFYHGHGGHHHGSPGHYDVIPGHLHRHGNHYDYHPPRAVWHSESTYGPGHSSGYYPSTGPTSRYPQSSSISPSPYIVEPPARTPGSIGHVDDVAVQLERQVNQLCLEMYYNYRHNPGFNETYREAYEILNTAKQIHAMEHGGDRQQMRQAATRIDRLFHHVQDDVRHWTRYGSRYIGPGGLRERMNAVEDTLHHLMQDIGAVAQ